jgi:hypothetical protein
MNTEKQKIDLKSTVLGALLGTVITLSIAAATSSHLSWEYKIVAGKVLGSESQLDSAINTSTAQGWEFVSASPSTEQWGFAVMKREKK